MVLVLPLGEGVRVGVLPHLLLLLLERLRRVVLLLLERLRRGGLLNRVLLPDVLLRRRDPLHDRLWGQWVQIEGLR